MEGHVQKNALKDLAIWQKDSNYTKSRVVAWMIITSRKRNVDQLENCPRCAHKLSWNAYIWHELVGLTFYDQWTNLLDQSPNGQEHVTEYQLAWFPTFITRMTTDSNIVMWVSRLSSVGWVFFPRLRFCRRPRRFWKSTSGGISCIFGSRAFVTISWMCKKTNFSIPQFYRIRNHFVGCWTATGWIICSGFMGRGDGSVTFVEQYQTTNQSRSRKLFAQSQIQPETKWIRDVDKLSHVGHFTTNAHSSQGESQLYNFEDNEAVIKMMIKGRSPTMRHVRWSPKETSHVMSGTVFFVCWTSWISQCFPAAIFFRSRKQSVISKRVQESTLKEGSAVAKPRLWILYQRTSWVRRKILRKIRVIQTAWKMRNWIRVRRETHAVSVMIPRLDTDARETRRTIVLSCSKSEDTDWREDTLKKFKQQKREFFWNKRKDSVPKFP